MQNSPMPPRYYDLNSYFQKQFGCRVHKLTVDAGLTCPNRDGTVGLGGCIYCNVRGSGTGAHAQGLSITQQLERGKAAVAQRFKAKKFVAYFQSFSNTYAPVDHLRAIYTEALAVPDVVGLSIGTRPDCVNDAVLDLLQELARDRLVWIEYGLQSAHDFTLKVINRGHDVAAFEKAVQNTAGRGILICVHVILGLPGETPGQMMASADYIANLPIDGLKLHLLYVVRGTPMETLYRSGAYQCLEQEAYADLVCDFLQRVPPTMVIQRLTGDPHRDELVAPAWSLEKTKTLSLINTKMVQKDIWQGKLWKTHPDEG
ncbi:MAG: TIGR01212 family radical SAM protein [Desulfobacteraceae bacterium]|nr:TIGR01212 family radical SAM protein [Desulfobacteraceae bacterium]